MVYIHQFEQPIAHAKYYIGWTHDVETFHKRMKYHKSGHGARITAHAAKEGIGFSPVVIVPGATRTDERNMKRQKNTPRLVKQLLKRGFAAEKAVLA